MPSSPAPTQAASAGSPRRRPALLAAAGVAAFAVSLVACLPAHVVAPDATVVGTVWHGAAALPNGAQARWDWSPGASLAHAALAAATTIDGPDTVVEATTLWRPGGVGFIAVRGRAGWSLLAAAIPGLPRCTLPLELDLARVAASGIDGTIRSRAGVCDEPGGARAVPRLVATFAGQAGRVTTWTDRATTLAAVGLANGVVRLHVTPAGAAVLPIGRGDLEVAL